MAIATLATTRDEQQIVMCEDPDVDATDPKDCGWIPRKSASVRSGADVVTIRPLSVDERASSYDAGPDGKALSLQRALAMARLGVVEVNGERDRKKIGAWFEMVDNDPLFFLGNFIRAVTNGSDPQELQRLFLSDEEAPPLGESKSE